MTQYVAIKGSASGHCCFDWTVVDTAKPLIIGGKRYKDESESVCECFDKESADLIAAALNRAAA